MGKGIKDKVAILGMGCAHFGERWGDDADTLMVEAYTEALKDAGIETAQIDAAWLAVGFDAVNIGPSGIALAMALRLHNTPVTKVENYCASGTEAFRGAQGHRVWWPSSTLARDNVRHDRRRRLRARQLRATRCRLPG